MDFQHVNVKLCVEGDGPAAMESLIPIFHRWIQEKVFDELLLDVADYTHVPEGPGVILIGLQADYALDNTDGKLGVLYNRKAAFDGTNQDRLKHATLAALNACKRMENEPTMKGKLQFNFKEIQIVINDRLLAPNTAETRSAFDPELKTFAAKLFKVASYQSSYEEDKRKRFGVSLKLAQPLPLATLLANLAS